MGDRGRARARMVHIRGMIFSLIVGSFHSYIRNMSLYEHYDLQFKWSLMKSLLVSLGARLDPQRQSLECSPNPTWERTKAQGSFVFHRADFGQAVQPRAQGSRYYLGAKNPGGDRNE